MLLVDHGDGERGEADVGLDQRVRPDHQRQLAARQLAEDVCALASRRGAREQLAGERLGAHQPLDRREMLFGEGLGRRHQRRLALMLDRAQHRVQRHDRLAAADLPHQQPLHRPRLAQVRVDRVDRRELVAGRLERQAVQPPPAQPRLAVQPVRAGSRPPPRAAAQERELREQQLLEGQPAPPRLEVLREPGKVHRGERARPVRQPLGRASCRRERLRHVVQRALGALHEGQDLRRRDALRGRVMRHRSICAVNGRGRIVGRGRVVGDAEAAPRVCLAVQQQARPGRVALDQPRLVEEGRPHRTGRVEDLGLDQRAHAAPPHRARGDRANLDRDGRLLATAQRRHRAGLAAVAGQVLEQVTDRAQAERAHRGRHALGGNVELGFEPRGPGPAQRRTDQLGARDAAARREGARERARAPQGVHLG